MSVIDTINRTEVSRLGTDRSSMEQLFLTCLQAQLMINKVNSHKLLQDHIKSDLILTIKESTKKGCFKDAKAD